MTGKSRSSSKKSTDLWCIDECWDMPFTQFVVTRRTKRELGENIEERLFDGVAGEVDVEIGEAIAIKPQNPFVHRDLFTPFWEPVMISARVLGVLKRLRATGFSIRHAIKIYDRFEKRLLSDEFTGVRLVEGIGKPDKSRGFELLEYESDIQAKGAAALTGIFCDTSTWTGADIFCPQKSSAILLSPRLGSALRRLKLKGIRIRPLEEYGRGRVEWEFRKLRARKRRRSLNL